MSARELQIIQLIYDGFTNKEIAERLHISENTATTHRKNILKKLKLKNTALLVRYVIEHRLVK